MKGMIILIIKTVAEFLKRSKSAIKRSLSLIINLIKNSKNRKTAFIAPCVFFMVAALVISISFNVSYAMAVSLDGKTIGYVSSGAVYTEAIESIKDNMEDEKKHYLNDVDLKESVTTSAELLTADEMTEAIVENIEEIALLVRQNKTFALVTIEYECTIFKINITCKICALWHSKSARITLWHTDMVIMIKLIF